MPELVKPEELDYDVLINEVITEVHQEDNWQGFAETLANEAQSANTTLAVLTDAEGQFVCLAAREMAEWLEKLINVAGEISELVERHPDRFQATPAGHSLIGGQRFPPPNNTVRTHPLERALAALEKLE